MAVHGTTLSAWELIGKIPSIRWFVLLTHLSATHGLSKMKRNHIHLAQGIPGDNVISGRWNFIYMRSPIYTLS
jgi:2'-phosphotransferase